MDVEVPLDPGATVAGGLVDEGGKAVPGGRVCCWPAGMGQEEARQQGMCPRVSAKEDGSFEIRGLPPGKGTYSLFAESPECYLDGEVNLPEGATTTVRMKHGETISGRVQGADGSRIVAFLLFRKGGLDDAPALTATRGESMIGCDGAFSVQNLRPGKYAVVCTHPDLTLDGRLLKEEPLCGFTEVPTGTSGLLITVTPEGNLKPYPGS